MLDTPDTAEPVLHPKLLAILKEARTADASDVHLVPDYPPTLRIHGRLSATQGETLTPESSLAMIESFLPQRIKDRANGFKDADCSVSFEFEGSPCRFRANVFVTRGRLSACLRHVPETIPPFDWMGFPAHLAERLVKHSNGLVIITGVAGSGKSTTLAALVNLLNEAGGRRILTAEEPIEFVHKPISSSVVTQREVGRDVDSFLDGLKYGLRQDPDVMLIGEIRDQETAQMALSAAETGHLILTTLHTKDAKGAVTRFVDLFPHEAQDDVRLQLSLSLRSVVSQHLVPAVDELGKRVLALEVLHVNHAIRSAIRLGKVESIESAIQTGSRDGMVSLDEDLRRLVLAQRITMDTALGLAKDASNLVS